MSAEDTHPANPALLTATLTIYASGLYAVIDKHWNNIGAGDSIVLADVIVQELRR